MSSFWLNVKKSLIYKEMEIKDLAFRSGVSYSTIVNGMNKNSMPHADIALKISRVLNMSLESLLGELDYNVVDDFLPTQRNLEQREIALYRKNKNTIDALEELPSPLRDAVEELVKRARDSIQRWTFPVHLFSILSVAIVCFYPVAVFPTADSFNPLWVA